MNGENPIHIEGRVSYLFHGNWALILPNNCTIAYGGQGGLKATNERQDYGAGILHQEAQFPIDQVYLIYKAPMPLSAHARPRETRYWLQMQVGLYVPLNPPHLAHRGS